MIDYLIPSLFHLENRDFLDAYSVRLVVSTSESDMRVIAAHPSIAHISGDVSVEYHIIPQSLLELKSPNKRALIMSVAHSFGVARCMDLDAVGSFLSPDMVVCSNFLHAITAGLSGGARAMIAPAYRSTYLSAFLNDVMLRDSGSYHRASIGHHGRRLARVFIEHTHDETSSFFFAEDTFLRYQAFATPTAALFQHARDEHQILGHGMSWFLTMIDFQGISPKNQRRAMLALSRHTIDAYFLCHLALEYSDSVRIVTDSDECFVLSWDRDRQVFLEPPPLAIPLTDQTKCALIRVGMASGLYDEMKLRFYEKPWFINGSENPTCTDVSEYQVPRPFMEFLREPRPRPRRLGGMRQLTRAVEALIKSLPPAKSRPPAPHLQLKLLLVRGWLLLVRGWLLLVRGWLLLVLALSWKIGNPLNQAWGGPVLAIKRVTVYSRLSRTILLHQGVVLIPESSPRELRDHAELDRELAQEMAESLIRIDSP